MKIHIGIDPASEYAGVAAIGDDGRALPPIGDYRPFALAEAHNTLIMPRLVRIKTQILAFILVTVPAHLAALGYGVHDWSYASITLEYAASNSYAKDKAGKQRNNHETMFANGRSLQAIAQDIYLHPVLGTVPYFEVRPKDSSVAVGAGSRATKLQRNLCSAVMEGGRFMEEGKKGVALGGRLDGATPDTLDAYAAAQAGRVRAHQALLQAAAAPPKKRRRSAKTAD